MGKREKELTKNAWFTHAEVGDFEGLDIGPAPAGHLIGIALATYGRDRGKRHDVTAKLQRAVFSSSSEGREFHVEGRVGIHTYVGDPCVGVKKRFRCWYTAYPGGLLGPPERFSCTEEQGIFAGPVPAGHRLIVTTATYGSSRDGEASTRNDVADQVQAIVDDAGGGRVLRCASPRKLFGDPLRGAPKSFELEWRAVPDLDALRQTAIALRQNAKDAALARDEALARALRAKDEELARVRAQLEREQQRADARLARDLVRGKEAREARRQQGQQAQDERQDEVHDERQEEEDDAIPIAQPATPRNSFLKAKPARLKKQNSLSVTEWAVSAGVPRVKPATPVLNDEPPVAATADNDDGRAKLEAAVANAAKAAALLTRALSQSSASLEKHVEAESPPQPAAAPPPAAPAADDGGGGGGGGGGDNVPHMHRLRAPSSSEMANHAHCNWLRVAFALRFLCEGVAPFVARRTEEAQAANVAHFAAQSIACARPHAEGDVYDPKRAPCAGCDAMVAHFASLHKGAGKARPPALNTRGGKKHPYSVAAWHSVEGAWDVAKLFSKLPSPSSSARDADLTALMNVVVHYEGAFHLKAAPSLTTWIRKAVAARNATMHQGDLELGDEAAAAHLDVVRRTLGAFDKAATATGAADGGDAGKFPGFAAALDRVNAMVAAKDAYFRGNDQDATRKEVLQAQKLAEMERQLEEQWQRHRSESEGFRKRLEKLEKQASSVGRDSWEMI